MLYNGSVFKNWHFWTDLWNKFVLSEPWGLQWSEDKLLNYSRKLHRESVSSQWFSNWFKGTHESYHLTGKVFFSSWISSVRKLRSREFFETGLCRTSQVRPTVFKERYKFGFGKALFPSTANSLRSITMPCFESFLPKPFK